MLPSVKLTVPDGEPLSDVVVEVKVTDCPEVTGFGDKTSVVVVAALFTVWAKPVELLPVWFESPP